MNAGYRRSHSALRREGILVTFDRRSPFHRLRERSSRRHRQVWPRRRRGGVVRARATGSPRRSRRDCEIRPIGTSSRRWRRGGPCRRCIRLLGRPVSTGPVATALTRMLDARRPARVDLVETHHPVVRSRRRWRTLAGNRSALLPGGGIHDRPPPPFTSMCGMKCARRLRKTPRRLMAMMLVKLLGRALIDRAVGAHSTPALLTATLDAAEA